MDVGGGCGMLARHGVEQELSALAFLNQSIALVQQNLPPPIPRESLYK